MEGRIILCVCFQWVAICKGASNLFRVISLATCCVANMFLVTLSKYFGYFKYSHRVKNKPYLGDSNGNRVKTLPFREGCASSSL